MDSKENPVPEAPKSTNESMPGRASTIALAIVAAAYVAIAAVVGIRAFSKKSQTSSDSAQSSQPAEPEQPDSCDEQAMPETWEKRYPGQKVVHALMGNPFWQEVPMIVGTTDADGDCHVGANVSIQDPEGSITGEDGRHYAEYVAVDGRPIERVDGADDDYGEVVERDGRIQIAYRVGRHGALAYRDIPTP